MWHPAIQTIIFVKHYYREYIALTHQYTVSSIYTTAATMWSLILAAATAAVLCVIGTTSTVPKPYLGTQFLCLLFTLLIIIHMFHFHFHSSSEAT